MKMIKMALLGGAAMAVTAASAQADDLEALKAQIETLNARVAAMETTPSVPAGYQLIAVSEGDMQETPGLGFTARERALYGSKSTIISVLPTADAPAGTTITWSGFARAGLVYASESIDRTEKKYGWDTNSTGTTADDVWNDALATDGTPVDSDEDQFDVKARGQIRVQASTDTAVGEVGVDIRLRGNFNGNGDADVYSDVAWGYWAMTPELTFGGGYAGSLGNLDYGYDGACTCHYTDNADLGFNPGDVSQMRLSYGSGPFSMAIALEDAGTRKPGFGANDETRNGDRLGAAGEIKYSGDVFSGEISGVWRSVDDEITSSTYEVIEGAADANWQVGIGVGFGLGDVATLSIAAAMGEGTTDAVEEGVISTIIPSAAEFWGVTALASFKMTDAFHTELAAGYKNREGNGASITDLVGAGAGDDIKYSSDGFEYETYGILGGVYYTPVDQLTIGVEAEWYTSDASVEVIKTVGGVNSEKTDIDRDKENFSIDLVSVWRF